LYSECAILSGTLLGSGPIQPTCTYNSVRNSINLTSISDSTSPIQGPQTLSLTLLSIKNPPSIAPSSSFTVITYYTNDIDSVVSKGTIDGITA
jgi:hypothetical protein